MDMDNMSATLDLAEKLTSPKRFESNMRHIPNWRAFGAPVASYSLLVPFASGTVCLLRSEFYSFNRNQHRTLVGTHLSVSAYSKKNEASPKSSNSTWGPYAPKLPGQELLLCFGYPIWSFGLGVRCIDVRQSLNVIGLASSADSTLEFWFLILNWG